MLKTHEIDLYRNNLTKYPAYNAWIKQTYLESAFLYKNSNEICTMKQRVTFYFNTKIIVINIFI